MFENFRPSVAAASRIWDVGALCRAIADSLEARFNPVTVRGEISGFSRAGSGHCYFTIKDAQGQLRCAMFRRAAAAMDFSPRDGELVELRGRLGVYEQRGDLQLIVESMQRAGQGAWFEQFLRVKAQLEAEGLFDPARKRSLPSMPRGIGVVTSLGAAALHDVATALRRRVPHIPVLIAPSLVQGVDAPRAIVQALQQLYARAGSAAAPQEVQIDVILLVRGGGSMEDLWAFNDEQVARTIGQSPVPIISGVGHETDFTIADFCADLRAPTPTAAAELVAQPRQLWLDALEVQAVRIETAVLRQLDRAAQRLDGFANRLGRPSQRMAAQRLHLAQMQQRLRHGLLMNMKQKSQDFKGIEQDLAKNSEWRIRAQRQHVEQLQLRVDLLNPQHVLERGYSVLTDQQGQVICDAQQAPVGTPLRALLAQGSLDVTVTQPKLL